MSLAIATDKFVSHMQHKKSYLANGTMTVHYYYFCLFGGKINILTCKHVYVTAIIANAGWGLKQWGSVCVCVWGGGGF